MTAIPRRCGLQHCEPDDEPGFWRLAGPPCPDPVSYEVQIDGDGDWLPLCTEHTAWARLHWQPTAVREAAV